MIVQLLAGASVGAGFLLLVVVLRRPVPGIAATLQRIDDSRQAQRSATSSSAAERADSRLGRIRDGVGDRVVMEASTRGWQMTRTREDLAATRRQLTTHMGTKVLLGLGASSGFPPWCG